MSELPFLAMASDLASLGAAGMMGTMWLWERRSNRQREEQLTDAHNRILRDEERLGKLTQVVEQNTAAIAGFNETQRETCETLKHILEELHHVRKH
jgi:phosphoenolpyruvate-protein kinase (PTS system EI component)